MLQERPQYFYNVLVMDIAIPKQQRNCVPNNLNGIWYLDNLGNQKSLAIYVHLDEDEDEEDPYNHILLFPDSIISISSSQGVKFYGRMLTD